MLSFSLYLSHAKILSNHIFVGMHQVTICFEMHKPNVVLKFCVLAFNITVCMKQNTSARLGTTWLSLNNWSVFNKFDVLLVSLYLSDARVLSCKSYFGKNIGRITICCERHKLNVVQGNILKFGCRHS